MEFFNMLVFFFFFFFFFTGNVTSSPSVPVKTSKSTAAPTTTEEPTERVTNPPKSTIILPEASTPQPITLELANVIKMVNELNATQQANRENIKELQHDFRYLLHIVHRNFRNRWHSYENGHHGNFMNRGGVYENEDEQYLDDM